MGERCHLHLQWHLTTRATSPCSLPPPSLPGRLPCTIHHPDLHDWFPPCCPCVPTSLGLPGWVLWENSPGPPRRHIWGLAPVPPWCLGFPRAPVSQGCHGVGAEPSPAPPKPQINPTSPPPCPPSPHFPHLEREAAPPAPAPYAPAVPVRIPAHVSALQAGFGPKLGHCSLPGAGCCGVGGSTHRHPHPHPLQAPAAGPRCWSCSLYGNRLHHAGCRGHPSPKWHSTHSGVVVGGRRMLWVGGGWQQGPPAAGFLPGHRLPACGMTQGGLGGFAACGHVGPALSPCAEAWARGGHRERGPPSAWHQALSWGQGWVWSPPPAT